MGVTMEIAITKPTIRSVFKGESAMIGYTVCEILVQRFVDSFGFSTKLNSTQIETLTVDTLENFAYESLEDIILFFKMARSGKLGETSRGIDSNLVFGKWFPVYLEKKALLREGIYTKEKADINSNKTSIQDVKKTYEAYDKKHKERNVIAFIDKITKDMDRQMLEDYIIDWSRDEKKKPYLDLLKIKRKTIK